ncbi:MAG TPA: glutamate ABC transporter substrate-binding protein [Mycobacteriales bacterium]|nr:glutamate ABC transporter substrate-binding protein [Mycobacteriales bacterium]
MNRTRVTAPGRVTSVCAWVCAAVLAVTLAGCTHRTSVQFAPGSTMDRIHQAGKIIVGVKFDQPGEGFRNLATGQLEGFDIEMAKIVAARLGLEPSQINYVETVSKEREDAITSGRVDIVIATYSITPERSKKVGQAGPYFVTGQRILVRKEDQDRITGPDKLAGVRVCSVAGSTSITTVQATYGARPVGLATYTECVKLLLSRSADAVDAVTTDDAILSVYAAQQPDRLSVVGQPFTEERYGIGYMKGDLAFCRFLTDTIIEAESDGEWTRAFTRTLGKVGVSIPERPVPAPC